MFVKQKRDRSKKKCDRSNKNICGTKKETEVTKN